MSVPLSFVEGLLAAIREGWSGEIGVSAGSEPAGQVMLREGRVAWAVCKGQSETLGIFLWRIGRITREQLAEVQRSFKAEGGKKKLGVLLEESGLMSHQVLRRCLLLHTRLAVEALLAIPEAAAELRPTTQPADERFLFGAEEILPRELSRDLISEWVRPEGHPSRRWQIHTAENAILEELTELPGCQLVAVISCHGEIVTAYTREDLDLDVLSVQASTWLEISTQLAEESRSGPLSCASLSCEAGELLVCWLDELRHHACLILAVQDERIILQIQTLLRSMQARLCDWIVRGQELERHVSRALPPEETSGRSAFDLAWRRRGAPDPFATRQQSEPQPAASDDEDPDTHYEPDVFSEVRRQTADLFASFRPRENQQSAFSIKRAEERSTSDVFAVLSRTRKR